MLSCREIAKNEESYIDQSNNTLLTLGTESRVPKSAVRAHPAQGFRG